ncbi:MAG TPA: hypothetical protein VLG73_10170 [Shinella sp.]|nr:hypothetical protein [Shinella sp.]
MQPIVAAVCCAQRGKYITKARATFCFQKRGRRMRAFVRNGGNILPVAALLVLALLAPRSQAEGLRPGLVSSDPLWTDRPVRIDPRKQAFERIEGEQKVRRFILRLTNRVQTFDSASFRDAGHLYVLSDVVAADPRQLCRRMAGAPSPAASRPASSCEGSS